MKKFEYKIYVKLEPFVNFTKRESLKKDLKDLGDKGWELVSTTSLVPLDGIVHYFKREIYEK